MGLNLALGTDDMKNALCEVISFHAKYRKVLQIRLTNDKLQERRENS